MENVVENQVMGIPVSRDELNSLKNKFNNNLNKTQKFDENVDNIVDITKAVVGVAGAVATIVLAVCPFDGPVGEIATFLATPAIIKGIDILADNLKDMLKKGNHMYSGTINTENGKVDVHKIIDGNTVTNAQNFSDSLNAVANSFANVKNAISDQREEISRTR